MAGGSVFSAEISEVFRKNPFTNAWFCAIMNVENKGEALVEINVSNLAKGMYFVKVGNYTIKFVKE